MKTEKKKPASKKPKPPAFYPKIKSTKKDGIGAYK